MWPTADPHVSFCSLQITNESVPGIDLMIAIGVIIVVLGFLGCCGAIRENRCMLLLVRTSHYFPQISFVLWRERCFSIFSLSLGFQAASSACRRNHKGARKKETGKQEDDVCCKQNTNK